MLCQLCLSNWRHSMSTSLLYHAFGIRGYIYTRTAFVWRNHPLCHRPGEKTVVLLGLRLVGSTPTWSNRENVPNPPHRAQSRGHSLRGSARPLRVLWSDPTGRDWVRG